MELLLRAAAATTPLLRVESRSGSSLLLTFEACPVLVRSDPRSGGLNAEWVAPGDTAQAPGEMLNETEPWWRVIGHPLVRVSEVAGQGVQGVALQFRFDADEPRVIEILPEGGSLRVRLCPSEKAPPPLQ